MGLVQIDGKMYRNVGIHFRGASSFSRVPAGSKRSLDLTLDYIDEDQQAGGAYQPVQKIQAGFMPGAVSG